MNNTAYRLSKMKEKFSLKKEHNIELSDVEKSMEETIDWFFNNQENFNNLREIK